MSEVLDSKAAGGQPEHGSGDEAVIAGALLRKAREATGLHVAALAVSLKVPVNKLEALEAGRLDLLPDAVFARALASSVCRTLKVDPAQVLQHLPHTRAPHLRTDATGINAPFRTAGASAAQPAWNRLMRPAPLVVLVLVVAAVVLLFLPQLQWEESAAKPEPAPSAAAAAGGDAAVQPAAPPVDIVAAPVSAPTPVAPAGLAATPPAPAGAAAPLAAPGIVVFQPKGETWVQVTDANGVVALRKTLAAGETTAASGALPLMVVVGRADATVVEVRGKAFDLAPVSRDNVARFEVK
ncbi:MAG TPA: helix-turn-helix domain-containing protein [Burkholderiaceae bacterium]|nr:helix-turn-helix domain-containing protein [Burkholderiaceae bacterium]